MNNIKVSIIVPSFNSVKTIEKTLSSISNQDYPNIELIVIDGGSTDGTVDIIKKYQDKIFYWVSEPDKGISDAFNKGLAVANGQYINFQGADDYLLNPGVIGSIVNGLDPENDILVCGKIERIRDSQDKEVIFKTARSFKNKKSLLTRMSLPHQALFTNRKFFELYGNFDTENVFCMDYELLLRAYKNFPKVINKDIYVSAWREGGIGTNRILEIYKEYYAIKKKHRVAPVFILYAIYLWSILKYCIKRIIRK
jgi:glycosyltransferase involved in cell wall biosynthesis